MNKTNYSYEDLKSLMVRLRDKQSGCPWDIKQNFSTIKLHTIEEAYEVADAIERNNMDDLKDELGDLLFQIIFHAQMAEEAGEFNMDDVVSHVTKKMIFRHPHVFENQGKTTTASQVENTIWEEQKAKEKSKDRQAHYLDDVTQNLPSLLLAAKIQKRVHKVGFQYPSFYAVLDKLSEEIEELKEAYEAGDEAHTDEELGDVLFVTALLSTETQINPEECLRKACKKFINRFNSVETLLAKDGLNLQSATVEDMTHAWNQIKENNQKP